MSKEDLINQLKEECSSISVDITKSELSKIYDAFMKTIKNVLHKGGEVRFHSVGTLYTMKSKEKQCRNPQNGNIMIVPPKMRVKFKTSQTLSDILNEEK
ncbi:MAG: HU family DNA-binding protein [Wolbachia endosymbiont of Tyrophagus putrescentiae]|nr:HU family DNA-binding protein [Wolbachia endosymbiont of Tyrophagus putrescentiae]